MPSGAWLPRDGGPGASGLAGPHDVEQASRVRRRPACVCPGNCSDGGRTARPLIQYLDALVVLTEIDRGMAATIRGVRVASRTFERRDDRAGAEVPVSLHERAAHPAGGRANAWTGRMNQRDALTGASDPTDILATGCRNELAMTARRRCGDRTGWLPSPTMYAMRRRPEPELVLHGGKREIRERGSHADAPSGEPICSRRRT